MNFSHTTADFLARAGEVNELDELLNQAAEEKFRADLSDDLREAGATVRFLEGNNKDVACLEVLAPWQSNAETFWQWVQEHLVGPLKLDSETKGKALLIYA